MRRGFRLSVFKYNIGLHFQVSVVHDALLLLIPSDNAVAEDLHRLANVMAPVRKELRVRPEALPLEEQRLVT